MLIWREFRHDEGGLRHAFAKVSLLFRAPTASNDINIINNINAINNINDIDDINTINAMAITTNKRKSESKCSSTITSIMIRFSFVKLSMTSQINELQALCQRAETNNARPMLSEDRTRIQASVEMIPVTGFSSTRSLSNPNASRKLLRSRESRSLSCA